MNDAHYIDREANDDPREQEDQAFGSAQPPGSALRDAAARLSVSCLNCKTCVHGFEDSDGSDGSYWYCGTTCSKHKFPETYLEDNGIDPATEKACWRPDFWKANTPEIMDMIDDTEHSMDRACAAWRKLLEEVMPPDEPNAPVSREASDRRSEAP